jgi:hypothetical protein
MSVLTPHPIKMVEDGQDEHTKDSSHKWKEWQAHSRHRYVNFSTIPCARSMRMGSPGCLEEKVLLYCIHW